jgi:hypothetical protein
LAIKSREVKDKQEQNKSEERKDRIKEIKTKKVELIAKVRSPLRIPTPEPIIEEVK